MPADGSTFPAPTRTEVLAQSISAALSEVGATFAPELMAQAAGFLAPSGDLDLVIDYLGCGIKQNAHPAQAVLLAYRDAQAERVA